MVRYTLEHVDAVCELIKRELYHPIHNPEESTKCICTAYREVGFALYFRLNSNYHLYLDETLEAFEKKLSNHLINMTGITPSSLPILNLGESYPDLTDEQRQSLRLQIIEFIRLKLIHEVLHDRVAKTNT